MSYMNNQIILRLNTNPEQLDSLQRLQAAFAEVCTALGPVVKTTRCWNRVALHHLTYRGLREQFPSLGSQMICNAIYSVCRSARLLFQTPGSPWCIDKNPGKDLPLLRFAGTAPVYFDRHTLSLRKGRLSMFTLEGRLHFDVALSGEDEDRFRTEKLREVILSRDNEGYILSFTFGEGDHKAPNQSELPEYLIVVDPEIRAA